MSFVLLTIGAVLLIAATRNSQDDLFALAKGDFTGPNNFIYWALSILAIGALGYIPRLKTLSVAFLTLVILALILNKKNASFISNFMQGIKSTTTPQTSQSNQGGNVGGQSSGGFQLPTLNGSTLPIP
jgi:hypothetical protein